MYVVFNKKFLGNIQKLNMKLCKYEQELPSQKLGRFYCDKKSTHETCFIVKYLPNKPLVFQLFMCFL